MLAHIGNLNWLAVLLAVIVGQVFLTVWFAVIFADPWAKAYGAKDKAEHTAAIPPWTYGIGLICMILLVIGIGVIQRAAGISGFGGGLEAGIVLGVCFALATALPGYAFLARYGAAKIAIGSQVCLIILLSVILAVWQ